MLSTQNKILATFLSTLLTTSALATETPCDYTSKDKVIYEGKIESVRLIKKKIQSNPKVKDVLKEFADGGKIKINKFIRYKVGEGI